MEKLTRPKVVFGINVRVVTTCGNMYVQLGWWNGTLHEVFATLGRAGGCAMCFNESLTRSITLGLRCGVPAEEYARQLIGCRCPSPHLLVEKSEQNFSCPDAIGRVLDKYGMMTFADVIELADNLEHGVLHTEDEEMEQAHARIQELAAAREELEDS
jgi:ribonucleoside-diphosphate reductase alpha chain